MELSSAYGTYSRLMERILCLLGVSCLWNYPLLTERILDLWSVSSAFGTYPLLMERILDLRNVSSAYGTYPLLTERILDLWSVSSAYGTYPLFVESISPLSVLSSDTLLVRRFSSPLGCFLCSCSNLPHPISTDMSRVSSSGYFIFFTSNSSYIKNVSFQNSHKTLDSV